MGILQQQHEPGFIREYEEDEETDAFVEDAHGNAEVGMKYEGTGALQRAALRGGGWDGSSFHNHGRRFEIEVEFTGAGHGGEESMARERGSAHVNSGDSRVIELEDGAE